MAEMCAVVYQFVVCAMICIGSILIYTSLLVFDFRVSDDSYLIDAMENTD